MNYLNLVFLWVRKGLLRGKVKHLWLRVSTAFSYLFMVKTLRILKNEQLGISKSWLKNSALEKSSGIKKRLLTIFLYQL